MQEGSNLQYNSIEVFTIDYSQPANLVVEIEKADNLKIDFYPIYREYEITITKDRKFKLNGGCFLPVEISV